MNNKLIATTLVVLVALGGFTSLVFFNDTEAALGDKDTPIPLENKIINGEDSTGKTWIVSTNESEFLGNAYTVTWSIALVTEQQYDSNKKTLGVWESKGDGKDPTLVPNSASSELTFSYATFSMKQQTSKNAWNGAYELKVTTNSSFNSDVEVLLESVIVSNVATADDTQKLYYKAKVVSGTAPNALTFTALSCNVGDKVVQAMSETTNPAVTNNARDRFRWYAVGLPEGLSMSDSGYVSGIPLKVTPAEGVDVKIYVTDRSSNVGYTGTMKVTVTDKVTSTFTYSVAVGSADYPTSGATNPRTVIAHDTDKVTLTVTPGQNNEVKEVKIVKNDGTYAVIDNNGTTNKYDLSSSYGTGSYTVTLTVGPTQTGTNTTIHFNLYILSSFSDVQAGIIPIPQAS